MGDVVKVGTNAKSPRRLTLIAQWIVMLSSQSLLLSAFMPASATASDYQKDLSAFHLLAKEKPCGDHSVLRDKRIASRLDVSCMTGRGDPVNERDKVLIDGLNPEAEALAAIRRNDTRVGVMGLDAPLKQGELPWQTPGLKCTELHTPQLFYFSGYSDTANEAKRHLEFNYRTFLRRYNHQLVNSRALPPSVSCTTEAGE